MSLPCGRAQERSSHTVCRAWGQAGSAGTGHGVNPLAGTAQWPRGKRGMRKDTPHPADTSQRCTGALGANDEAEPGGGVRLLCPQTPAEPSVRAVCPLGTMWE